MKTITTNTKSGFTKAGIAISGVSFYITIGILLCMVKGYREE
jgi:hypothetical protein